MAWYDEAVFYHIYPLGMLGAPKENSYSEDERKLHRLKGLKEWLPHIQAIGCNAIYIGPLFESVGHGYETTDYRKLDSRLGDNEDLKEFVKDCHKKGIRVIFDGVFNHVGRDFFAFKDVKANRENSRYCGWFLNLNFYGNNEYNDGFSYENWGGYNLLVKLNQRNPEVKDYICDVIRFWVSEFDVDGIRLDAADVLDFDYMKALRGVANEVKPDFWLMGEVIHGDYTRWVNEGTLHSVTNYTLHKALFSGHNDHNYFEIAHTVRRLYQMGGNRADGLKLYNFCDNHDVERIVNKLNNRADYLPIQILTYTLPGIPSVYYGSEFGIEGKKDKNTDAPLRPEIKYADHKDDLKTNGYTKIIAALGAARQASRTISYGDYREVSLTNRQYVYTRDTIDNTVIVAVNNDDNEAGVGGGGIRDGVYTGVIGGGKVTVSGGGFSAVLPAHSGEVWLPEDEYAIFSKGRKPEPIVTVKPAKKQESAAVKTEVPAAEKADKEAAVPAEVKTEAPAPVAAKNDKEANSPAKAGTQAPAPAAAQIDKEAPAPAEDAKKAPAPSEVKQESTAVKDKKEAPAKNGGAAAKYSLDQKYAKIDPDAIHSRNDYENMSLEELQVAILEKMASNGPVNDQMIKTVMDNVYHDSLMNWVKSFR
ncbi:MAG: alpha-amylase [Lachnospiraceae bacterium]|nr:alpha-amylase [Lachnospiraceae bacterium]